MNTAQNDHLLQEIQSLQFTNRGAAERLLLTFVQDVFPELNAIKVELRPLAVSLNSFNGFITLGHGGRLFFKTHVEPGSVVNEYYNSKLLADSGYKIMRPRYTSTEYGKQFLIYDVIEAPSVFDVARAIEQGRHVTRSLRDTLPALTEAQNAADNGLLVIYERTLSAQPAEEAAKAAVHQLFYHRLGERYRTFYEGRPFEMPALTLPWETLLSRSWTINGTHYSGNLMTAIDLARQTLSPAKPAISIVGHGDAHNGNVFFTTDGLMYFDPAFGGRHHPLLDLAKPIFHNVFATWMYHAQEVSQALNITVHDDGYMLTVEHDYTPSAVRKMFFDSKIERVLKPLIRDMKRQHGWSPLYWRTLLKSALMCCPLLTMNLADRTKFPASVGLLGLAFAVEMGLPSYGNQHNMLDAALYSIE
jgi:hypothetical protein